MDGLFSGTEISLFRIFILLLLAILVSLSSLSVPATFVEYGNEGGIQTDREARGTGTK